MDYTILYKNENKIKIKCYLSNEYKEMIFEHTGKISIDDYTELMNPKMQLQMINYNLISNEFELIVLFWEVEGGYKFARMFKFINDNTGNLSISMVMEMIATNDILNKFTPIK